MNRPAFPQQLVPLRRKLQLTAVAGAAVLLAGLWFSPARAWADLLLGSFTLVCLGLAGLFFVALQYATGAVWSVPLRRVGEAMTAALPAGAAGILLVLLGHPSLYPWYGKTWTNPESYMGFRNAWLSYPFFLARAVVYLALWLGFAWAMLRNSRRQDTEGGMELSRRNTRLGVTFMVVFGLTFWLASTDWVMTLEPEWSSTIFGIYHFTGMFLAGLAVITLLALALRRQGALRHGVQDAQFLDLGRLMVAFSVFWAYIWFSQYMLIWYANLTAETPYMMLRTSHGWGTLFVVNLQLNWTVPFLLLLPRANKMNERTLTLAATVLLLGRVTDLYLMILPPFSPASPLPALWDFAAIAFAGSCFVLLSLRAFFAAQALPVGDPRLAESLHTAV